MKTRIHPSSVSLKRRMNNKDTNTMSLKNQLRVLWIAVCHVLLVTSNPGSTTALEYDEGDDGHKQINLDPLQICLYPTYITLAENILQKDMRMAMKYLVSTRLESIYGVERFEYFDFIDPQIDWYSGEQNEPVCGDLHSILPPAKTASAGREGTFDNNTNDGPVPCTCALYPAAVVLITPLPDDDPSLLPNATMIKPEIASSLEEALVQTLHDIATSKTTVQTPAYFEIKAASISWDAADRQDGDGSLVLPPPTLAPISFSITQSPTNNNGNGNIPNNLESTNSISNNSNNDRLSQIGVIIAIAVGCAVALTFLIIGSVKLRQRCHRNNNSAMYSDDDLEDGQRSKNVVEPSKLITDAATVIDEYEDEYHHEPVVVGRRRSRLRSNERNMYRKRSSGGDTDGSVQTGDISDLAQYQQGELLECISVASEWTLGTTEDASSQGRSTAGNTTRLQVAAEMLAAQETFERDRQITLQKDMLQSDWTATRANNGMMMGHYAASPPLYAAASDDDDNAVSFEQAYDPGQGEEVYLMPPRSSRSFRRHGI